MAANAARSGNGTPGSYGPSGRSGSSTGFDPWSLLISGGFSALSAWFQQRQADKAAGRQVDMSEQALALEKYMFEQQQQYQQQRDQEDQRRYENDQRQQERAYADRAPYRAIGRGALAHLGAGTGIDLPANFTNTRYGPQDALVDTNGRVSGPLQGGNLSTLGGAPPPVTPPGANVSQGSMATFRTPTGQHVLVPFSQIDEALRNGGVRIA